MARNVAMLVGSLRKDSYTRKIGNNLIDLAPDSLHIEMIEIGALPLYNQDLDTSPPSEWVAFRDRIRPQDGVLIATPEYNRSIPGGLKNAIDVGSRPFGLSVFTGKPCAIVSCSPGQIGGFGANHHLRQSCVFLDMPVMEQPETYVSHVDKALDENGKVNERAREFLSNFMAAYAAWVERIAGTERKRSAA
jgi:chromate reductase, NAD(P)H dehydrogenase (quinone)